MTAGLIMYRMKAEEPEVFLVHCGGPYFEKKDEKAWSMPKGVINENEDMFEAAKREFKEETSFDVPADAKFVDLGEVKRPGKIVHVWAFEGDCDVTKVKSNTCMVEWPPRSGKQIEIPEVDRGAFCSIHEARVKLFGYLAPIMDSFEKEILK